MTKERNCGTKLSRGVDKSRLVVVHLTKGNEGNRKGPYESQKIWPY